MANYKIIYKETLVHTFYVEANSEEEANKVFENQVSNGEIDFSDGEIDDTEIKIEKEE